jgi:hypothetical protein
VLLSSIGLTSAAPALAPRHGQTHLPVLPAGAEVADVHPTGPALLRGWTQAHLQAVQGCSVVWCGVVWCGVVWCGVVWCGVSQGVVWCVGAAAMCLVDVTHCTANRKPSGNRQHGMFLRVGGVGYDTGAPLGASS